MIVHGALPTLEIGLLAGGIGTVLGVVLGLVSGYVRGPLDALIRSAADVALTIPALAVLVVLAALLRTQSIELMALIVGLLAWPYPTRAIRAQTLTLRERGFVTLAVLSGRNAVETVFLEILPNLLPYVTASLVGAVSGGIMVSVGLQLLGLGPITTPDDGPDAPVRVQLRRRRPRHVVVVGAADALPGAALCRSLPHQRLAGRVVQPAASPNRGQAMTAGPGIAAVEAERGPSRAPPRSPVEGLRVSYPGRAGRVRGRGRDQLRRGTRARSWAWSASRAAASRPLPWRSFA